MIKLITPTPIVCPNQTNPKYVPMGNTFIIDVMHFINSGTQQIKAATIDGYIVDKDQNITRLLLKREFVFESSESFQYIQEYKNIFLEFPEIKILKEGYRSLATQLDCGIDFLFVPQYYPYGNFEEDFANRYMALYTIEPPSLNRAKFQFISANEYAERIFSFRKRTFINNKPLKVASTYLECYLANDDRSKKKNPFAGDLDLFIYEGHNSKLIVEFKTHNLNTPIKDEFFNKYEFADRRRIQVLVDLAIATNSYVLFVFWGSKHNQIKIQLIDIKKSLVEERVFDKNAELLAKNILELCNT